MKRKQGNTERAAGALLEEATHLLRSAPARVHLSLLSGTIPFVMGFLYFWTDMSKGAQAGKSAPAAAFVMTLLFIWMKTCQSFFSSRLREHLLGRSPRKWSIWQWMRAMIFQASWQPTGFLVLPFAMLIALPFGWAYAFYRNLLVFGTCSGEGFMKQVKTSWRQATLSPRQNHTLITIISIFGLFVFINFMQSLLLLPFLLKTLLGVESIFTRAGFSALNTTLLAVSWGMSYLALEPLVNAIYTLRCFYGESIATGEDLRSELAALEKTHNRGRRAVTATVTLLISFFLFAAPMALESSATGSTNVESRRNASLAPEEIDRALERVLKKRQYQWRMPRVEEPESVDQEPGFLDEFFASIAETLRSWGRSIADAIDRFFEWLADILPRINPDISRNGRTGGLGISPDLLVLILILVIGALGGLVTYRIIRQRQPEEPEPGELEEGRLPDIEDEGTLADELQSNEWFRMASELMDKGEARLALRALYLACLAHLADIELVSIASYKSNRDYVSELVSRSHALPGLSDIFTENVRTFERVWYGRHGVSREMVSEFEVNNRRIFEIAEPA